MVYGEPRYTGFVPVYAGVQAYAFGDKTGLEAILASPAVVPRQSAAWEVSSERLDKSLTLGSPRACINMTRDLARPLMPNEEKSLAPTFRLPTAEG